MGVPTGKCCPVQGSRLNARGIKSRHVCWNSNEACCCTKQRTSLINAVGIIVVLTVAATGLLWLLFKRRS